MNFHPDLPPPRIGGPAPGGSPHVRHAAPLETASAAKVCTRLSRAIADLWPGWRIELPAIGRERVRRLVHRGAPRPTSRLFSVTLARSVECESALEVDTAQLLDACPSVHSFAEQPLKLHFLDGDGRPTWHVPDFVVCSRGGVEFVEVKYARDLTPSVMDRTQLLQSALAALGVGYRLFTEQLCHDSHRLENAQRLLRRGRDAVPADWSLRVIDALHRHRALPLDAFGWSEPGSAEAGWIARLIIEGVVQVDFREQLTGNSAVFLSSSNSKETVLWPSAASK